MPVYICYRGDWGNQALEEKGCFLLQDAQGRSWLCFVESRDKHLGEVGPEDAPAVQHVEDLLRKYGLSTAWTEKRTLDCPDLGLMRGLLAEDLPTA